MDPRENVKLASHLASERIRKVEPEACHRGAFGRAYYAVFVAARDLLTNGGKVLVPTSGVHQDVVRLLKSSTIPLVKAVGSSLETLHRQRKAADYDLGLKASSVKFSAHAASLQAAAAATMITSLDAAAAKDPTLGIP